MMRLNLGGYLQRRNLTPYRLVKESGLAQATVYNMARVPAQRVDLDTVSTLLKALERLTGEQVTMDDLLEETAVAESLTAAGVPYTGDAETDAVLNDHPDILNRVARIEQGNSKLIPIGDIAAKYGVKL
ncbi:helix-turn-helix transcriptional regulator (plasmid) [Deinococcus radiomollis]|uniref:helix-turn-helix domain-containing protein n=1 Tax=Deinococcus radiomollis TaxID=468916 RepID=UPI0038921130